MMSILSSDSSSDSSSFGCFCNCHFRGVDNGARFSVDLHKTYSKIDKLTSENFDLKVHCYHLEEKLRGHVDHDNKDVEIARLQARLSSADNQLNKQQELMREAAAAIDSTCEERDCYMEQLRCLEKQYSDLEKNFMELQQDNEKYRSSMHDSIKDTDNIAQQLVEIEAENVNLKMTVASLTEDIQICHKKLSQYADNLEGLTKERVNVEIEKEHWRLNLMKKNMVDSISQPESSFIFQPTTTNHNSEENNQTESSQQENERGHEQSNQSAVSELHRLMEHNKQLTEQHTSMLTSACNQINSLLRKEKKLQKELDKANKEVTELREQLHSSQHVSQDRSRAHCCQAKSKMEDMQKLIEEYEELDRCTQEKLESDRVQYEQRIGELEQELDNLREIIHARKEMIHKGIQSEDDAVLVELEAERDALAQELINTKLQFDEKERELCNKEFNFFETIGRFRRSLQDSNNLNPVLDAQFSLLQSQASSQALSAAHCQRIEQLEKSLASKDITIGDLVTEFQELNLQMSGEEVSKDAQRCLDFSRSYYKLCDNSTNSYTSLKSYKRIVTNVNKRRSAPPCLMLEDSNASGDLTPHDLQPLPDNQVIHENAETSNNTLEKFDNFMQHTERFLQLREFVLDNIHCVPDDLNEAIQELLAEAVSTEELIELRQEMDRKLGAIENLGKTVDDASCGTSAVVQETAPSLEVDKLCKVLKLVSSNLSILQDSSKQCQGSLNQFKDTSMSFRESLLGRASQFSFQQDLSMFASPKRNPMADDSMLIRTPGFCHLEEETDNAFLAMEQNFARLKQALTALDSISGAINKMVGLDHPEFIEALSQLDTEVLVKNAKCVADALPSTSITKVTSNTSLLAEQSDKPTDDFNPEDTQFGVDTATAFMSLNLSVRKTLQFDDLLKIEDLVGDSQIQYRESAPPSLQGGGKAFSEPTPTPSTNNMSTAFISASSHITNNTTPTREELTVLQNTNFDYSTVSQLKEKYEMLQNMYDELAEIHNACTVEISSLRRELDTTRSEETSESQRQLMYELESVEKQKTLLQSRLEDLQDENRKLGLENEDLELRIQSIDRELREQLAEAAYQYDLLLKDFNKTCEEKDEVLANIEEVCAEKNKYLELMQDLELQKQKAYESIEFLNSQFDATQAQLTNLQSKLTVAQADKEDLLERNQSLKEALNHLDEEYKRLSSYPQQLEDKEVELETLTQQLHENNKKILALESENTEALSQNVELLEKVSLQEEHISQWREEVQTLQEERNSLKDLNNRYESDNSELKIQLDSLMSEKEKCDFELMETAKKLVRSSEIGSSYQQLVEDLQQEAREKDDKLAVLEQSNQQLSHLSKKLEEKVSHNDLLVANMRLENDDLQAKLDEINEAWNNLKVECEANCAGSEELTECKAKVAQLTAEVETVRSELSKALTDKEFSDNARRDLEHRVHSLEADTKRLSADLESSKSAHDLAESKLAELRATMSRKETEYTTYRNKAIEMRGKLDSRNTRLDQCQKQNIKLKERIADMDSKLLATSQEVCRLAADKKQQLDELQEKVEMLTRMTEQPSTSNELPRRDYKHDLSMEMCTTSVYQITDNDHRMSDLDQVKLQLRAQKSICESLRSELQFAEMSQMTTSVNETAGQDAAAELESALAEMRCLRDRLAEVLKDCDALSRDIHHMSQMEQDNQLLRSELELKKTQIDTLRRQLSHCERMRAQEVSVANAEIHKQMLKVDELTKSMSRDGRTSTSVFVQETRHLRTQLKDNISSNTTLHQTMQDMRMRNVSMRLHGIGHLKDLEQLRMKSSENIAEIESAIKRVEDRQRHFRTQLSALERSQSADYQLLKHLSRELSGIQYYARERDELLSRFWVGEVDNQSCDMLAQLRNTESLLTTARSNLERASIRSPSPTL